MTPVPVGNLSFLELTSFQAAQPNKQRAQRLGSPSFPKQRYSSSSHYVDLHTNIQFVAIILKKKLNNHLFKPFPWLKNMNIPLLFPLTCRCVNIQITVCTKPSFPLVPLQNCCHVVPSVYQTFA